MDNLMGALDGAGSAFGTNFNNPTFRNWMRHAGEEEEELIKAMTDGGGVASAGVKTAGDASPLKTQMLHNILQRVSASMDDFGLWKRIKKEKVYSNAFEFSATQEYGINGDGFISESDTSLDGSSVAADDVYARRVANVKYMATARQVGLIPQLIKTIANPMAQTEENATTVLAGMANLALYFGDDRLQAKQFPGLMAQMLDWCYPAAQGGLAQVQDDAIYYDAGGEPIGRDMLEDIATINKKMFGAGSELFMSTTALGDTQSLLFPFDRFSGGNNNGGDMGMNRNKFSHSFGSPIRLTYDNALTINRAMRFDGAGVTGKPKATADTGCTLTLATGALASPHADGTITPSTAPYYVNHSVRSYATLATAPALPGRGVRGIGRGSNQLQAGTYYYAISAVLDGRETAPVYCRTGSNAGVTDIANITGIAVAAGKIVRITITHSGLTSTPAGDAVKAKFRIYRTRYGNAATPTSVNDFDLVGECGQSSSVTSVFYDNGFTIPGTDNAFLLTMNQNAQEQFFFAQLLPIIKRELPQTLMSDLFGFLLFGTPVLLTAKKHIWIRNVGRLNQ